MFSLPSFLSFPFTFPSLPTITVPGNIQRRFLSYVLKRALGRFVKAGGLDVDRIQAQMSEGWVEIDGLEVDTEEINSLIPTSIPLILNSGTLSKVTARVPFPNLWSDPLSLTLDTLVLDFSLSSPSPKGKAPESPARTKRYAPFSPSLGLGDSMTTAADTFLHDELDAYEEAELDRSIRQSLILNQTDPFSRDDVPGAFPGFSTSTGESSTPLPPNVESTTVLAGLVERILARLEFKVKDARIRIRHDDSKYGGIFELRIGQVIYADEPDSGSEDRPRQTVRSIKLSSVAVYMLPIPTPTSPSQPRFLSSTSRSSSVSSTSSTTASSGNGNADMYMSQAVADLRESTMYDIESEASVYQSAMSERIIEEEGARSQATSRSKQRSRSRTPTRIVRKALEDVLLLSFGTEDLVLRMKTIQPSPSPITTGDAGERFGDQSAPASHPRRLRISRSSLSPARLQLPAIDLDLSIGTLAVLLLPSQTATVLATLQTVLHPAAHSNPRPASPEPYDVHQPRLNATLQLKGLHLCLIYDMQASSDSALVEAAAQYWSKPSTTSLPFGHLKLRLEGLEAIYATKGYVPFPQSSTSSKKLSAPPPTRRASTSAQNSAQQPVIQFSLHDASIFEYLATDRSQDGMSLDDIPPGGCFPVFIFDINLLKQYDAPLGSQSAPTLTATSRNAPHSSFPEFDSVDWRNSGLQRRSGSTEKAWKVRHKGRGVLKNATTIPHEGESEPVLVARTDVSHTATTSLDIQPMHIFLDLSLVERLLPMLRSVAPVIRSASPDRDMSTASSPVTPVQPSTSISAERPSHYVLEDLDAQASSLSTIQPTRQAVEALILRCPLVRLDIRCPAPPNRRGSWGDGAHLRSGIVTLDIHGFITSIGLSPFVPQAPSTVAPRRDSHFAGERNSVDNGPAATVDWQRMILFFSRVSDKKASAFIVIGPLAPEPNDVDDSVLLPTIELTTAVNRSTAVNMSVITCRIPSVQAKIKQSTIEGLQFFADDITHWLDGAFGDGTAPKPRDDLKMIGSRFFGSKGSSSASSSAIEDEEDESTAATVLRIVVSEADIALQVPRGSTASTTDVRVLALHTFDMDVKVESNTTGRQETAFTVAVMDADFTDRSDSALPTRIFGRTTPLTLTMHNQPLVYFRFTSISEPVTKTKETGMKIACSCCTIFVTKDITWVKELALFAKTPEGVFEDVVPSEVTRIAIQLYDCSLHVSAPTLPGAMLAVLGVVDVKADLVSDAEENLVELGVSSSSILAVDNLAVIHPLESGHAVSVEAWRRAGFASIVELMTVEVRLFRALNGSQEIVLDILQAQLRVTACADSLASLGTLVGDLGQLAPAKHEPVDVVKCPASPEHSVNIFDSLDEDAFNRVPDVISGADLMDDDLPTNLDYLDQAARNTLKSKIPVGGESLRSWQADDADPRFAAEVNGETIKILHEEPFDIMKDYWESLPVVTSGYPDATKLGKTRIRLHACSIGIFLHDGYDWQRTRKIIEDEVKAVRRRLERIRQLLASGQKADESIESARSVLFNSVYIGLDQGQENLDSAALLAAIDEELDDLGAETASQSSWQTAFPPTGERPTNKKARLKGRRLTRSKRPQIEISLTGVRSDVDLYGPEEATASKVQVMVKSLEILDHIKSSTWKKFLTEMKADSRGNMRETDADMVRVELVAVRPSLASPAEENRLKLEILPLRLHVDQDALDFLKRFSKFSLPPETAPSAPSETSKAPVSSEPFFQYVEVFPIELKLDYKPKRIDFAALREGRIIELMNFFHFDGAEMTLRHITLSGITGWSRLSTTLQDIWTPDVKANQLADVISGVSPIRSMVNVGSGVADLILLPIEQYRKDGRVARGVQRGTNSFVRSTAMEMMKLGAKLATGTQVILEEAEGVLDGKFGENVIGEVEVEGLKEVNSEDEADLQTREVISRYANQPEDVREGVQAAYRSLSRNINSAAQTILAVPMEVYERSGDDGPLRAVVRAVPIAVLKPMIGASEAVSKTLLGMRNSLDPEGRKELVDKYK